MRAQSIQESATAYYPPEWESSEMASVTYETVWSIFMQQLQYMRMVDIKSDDDYF